MFKFNKTNIIELKKIEEKYHLNNFIYGKDESLNPSGSIKDRPVYQMLLDYKDCGVLKDGSTIIEATSGNTGIALSYFSKIFNYKCLIVMPSSMSNQRREMIKKYGASLYLVDGGMKECIDKTNELLKDIPNSFIFNQFNNKSNSKAHYLMTAREINEDINDVDYIFAGIGSGGTISGIGSYFKEIHHKVKIIGVEPLQSPLLTKGVAGSHLIQGIGANFIPSIYDKNVVDEVIDVDDKESINIAKEIRDIEGIDIGISSGAALLGAIKYIEKYKITNKKIVVIFPDKGDRYIW